MYPFYFLKKVVWFCAKKFIYKFFFEQLPVIFPSDTVDSLTIKLSDILKPGKEPEKNETISVAPGSEVKVNLLLSLPVGGHVNDEAPSKWTAVIQGNMGILEWSFEHVTFIKSHGSVKNFTMHALYRQ